MAKVASGAVDQNLQAVSGLPMVTATELKNNFGGVIQQAVKSAVAIARHSRVEFVLLPIEQYQELQKARSTPLEALTAQFDAMVARMNTPAAKRGVKRLFQASPAALGKSAVEPGKAPHGR